MEAMDHVDPEPEGWAESLALTASLLASAPFPVYCLTTPALGRPMIGDAHTVNGVVESIGIAYGNPLVRGPVLQVITAPAELAHPLDYLLGIETTEPDPVRGIFPGDGPERPESGSCRVVLAESDRQAMLKRDGDWWGFQIQAGEVTVSVVASGPVHQELVLSEVEDLPALIHDRAEAIAERVAEARRDGKPRRRPAAEGPL
jgi:hypothetical protein